MEIKMINVLTSEVKRLLKQQMEVPEAREKGFIYLQSTKDAVAAKHVTEREVLVRTKEIRRLQRSENQTFFTCSAEAAELKA